MTHGTMAVDHELRIDFDKLRKDRVLKAKEQMKKDGIGALLAFDPDNIRYVTSTKIAEWNLEIRSRYALVPLTGDAILFEVGSAIRSKKMLCPWITDIRPSKTDMQGCLPPDIWEKCASEIVSVLDGYGLRNEPLAIDAPTVDLIRALERQRVRVVDGRSTLMDAQAVKTKEEIQLIELSAAMVDAAFWEVARFIHPGVKENEVAALIKGRLHQFGSENVLNAQVISGNRTHPHPHDVSDRMIRPGDLIFIDIANNFCGYKTCYYRSMVCGKPTEKQKRIYRKTYEWLYSAIEMVRPGVTTADVARCWPDYRELGYESEDEALALQLGHGVGMTHWGKPIIARASSLDHPEQITKDMVIALETYYGEGEDGARIEDEVVVTDDGCRVITRFPSDELTSCW